MTMSFHPLLIGGNPFSVTSVYTLISFLEQRFGVWSAMGGTGSIVKGMAGLIEGQGGKIECNAEVEEILVDEGAVRGVRLADGRTLHSDLVVSNADAAWTYRHLIKAEHRKAMDGSQNRPLTFLKWTVRLVLRHRGTIPRRTPPFRDSGATL
jgi:phytoene desaturase